MSMLTTYVADDDSCLSVERNYQTEKVKVTCTCSHLETVTIELSSVEFALLVKMAGLDSCESQDALRMAIKKGLT